MNLAKGLLDVARRLPGSPAITAAGRTLSYGDLAERVLRLAGGLRRGGLPGAGLQPGERVVLCMENCAEAIEALFACWAAGLVAVPVNAKLHANEVAHIVGDAGARLLITTPGLAEDLAPLPGRLETLRALVVAQDDSYRQLAAADPIACQDSANGDVAWIFYTSGTTGRPKGATLSYRNLWHMSYCYYADVAFIDESETCLHAAPLSHGAGLLGLSHMLRGGHQVVLSKFEADTVLEAFAAYPKVSLFAAPTMVTRLIGSAEARPGNLKTLYYGGGPMYVSDLEKALALFGPRLYQLYGQGESPMTISGLSHRAHAETNHPHYRERLASCGVPRTGVAVRVVDDEDRDLPAGEVGEVLARSDCVMSGYWNNPAATAETLRQGWLHTGDLGSLDADRFLTLRDRSKDMIISGGSNIYPREVEEVLLRHPAVAACSVIGRPDPEWGEEVVAFVVAAAGQEVQPAELDRLCLESIARFKRPKHYRFVDRLPTNNYGKVLKTELRRRLAEEGG